MLRLAQSSESHAGATGKVVRLPGGFARAADHFTMQRPTKDGGAP